MRRFSVRFLTMLAMVQVMAFVFSCVKESDERPFASNTGDEQLYLYCVYTNEKRCVPWPVTGCPSGGAPKDECPVGYAGDGKVLSSSSNGNEGSSSSSVCANPSSYNSFNSFKTVKIDEQTWMAENLNYNVCGSLCYGENSPVNIDWGLGIKDYLSASEIQDNCAKYGRLYDWAAAMNLPAICNETSCASQISAEHRGICPTGWHLPNGEDWNVLMNYVETGNGSTHPGGHAWMAGKYLKAENGWDENGNGEDKYGFAALPGGCRYSNDVFFGVGSSGNWWSASEVSGSGKRASYRHMNNSNEYASWNDTDKSNLHSVRCVQDSPYNSSSSEDYEPYSSSSSSVCVNPSSYGSFNTVTIGEQIWMAENLNYNACGSMCYGENGQVEIWESEDYVTLPTYEIQDNCAKYGRLYNWATAMDIPESCNFTYCVSQINAKHRGICPAGWHIPSNAEWDQLYSYVDGSENDSKYLKATSGWNDDGNGQDTHGFAALPGGYGDDFYYGVGYSGYWWSASESSAYLAKYQLMYYREYHIRPYLSKSRLYSVRCLKD